MPAHSCALVLQCRLPDIDAASCCLGTAFPFRSRSIGASGQVVGLSTAVSVKGDHTALAPARGMATLPPGETTLPRQSLPLQICTHVKSAAPSATALRSLHICQYAVVPPRMPTNEPSSLAALYTWARRDQSTKGWGYKPAGGTGSFLRPGAHPKEPDLRDQGGSLSQGAIYSPLCSRLRPPHDHVLHLVVFSAHVFNHYETWSRPPPMFPEWSDFRVMQSHTPRTSRPLACCHIHDLPV